MSFGFSVGDFIAVLQLANKVRERFVDAPGQFKAISNEVICLSNVLHDIERVASVQVLPEWQKKNLTSVLEESRKVLNAIDKIVHENSSLTQSNSPSAHGKPRRAWKRLTWDPKSIEELRSRAALNVSFLNAFNGNLISTITSATKDGVEQLHKRQDIRERHAEDQAIFDWLTPTDYAPQQSDFFNRRQAGTGQWLLDSAEFQEWLGIEKKTLFCPGIPGAGKTILTAVVIDDLVKRFANNSTVGIAYIYCNFRRQDEQKAADLLTSLLKQLTQGRSSLPDSVKSLYNSHKDKRTRPSLDEILRTLQSIAMMYSRIFIVVDALDECQVYDGSRIRFLSEIFNLQTKCQASIFATSRFIPEISEKFKGSLQLEIRASKHDVQSYIDSHMLQLPHCVLHNSELQDEIKAEIIKAVDGMFLLAQLHLDSLKGKRSSKAIRTALKKLPTGSEAYDTAYEDAMERITGQLADEVELAKQVLSWIIYAKRPLTTFELEHALAVEPKELELDLENLCRVEDMVSVCAGLVTVDEESSIIRLVHYTTQEYFDRTQTHWFPNAEADITIICVTYLSFRTFESGYCDTDSQFEDRLQSNKLYDYAVHNWGHHARNCLTLRQDLSQAVEDFLKSEAKVAGSIQGLLAIKHYSSHSGYSQEVPRQMAGLHLVAYFGVREAIKVLLKKGADVDPKDTNGRTPLSWATERGHEAVARLFLESGKVDVDSKDTNGQTPLSWAAEGGHEAVVKLLLETRKVDVDSKDTNGQTPLSWAARGGHEAVVKLLLETGKVDVDSKDTNGQTPLSWAAEGGHEAVVKLLLETGKVDVDSKATNSQTSLSWAAESGHEAVVKLLLETGKVDVNSKDTDYGQTPLSWAARGGHEAVVKLLLETGKVDVNSKDTDYGQTPLSWAARGGHEAVVKLLLETGANIDVEDKHGLTVLRSSCFTS